MKKRSRALGSKQAKAQSSKALKPKRNDAPKAASHRSSATQQVAEWLETIGLWQYARHFVENDITFSILSDLTDQDLKELGVASLGHRRELLRAIAELHGVEKRPAKAAPPGAQQDTAERRQVTVMFSDLVGSTALSARMDPEDLREVISAYQKCVAEAVQRFGGFVAKYMGDGVLVYFGYPQAHEDDAERAVRAGLELVQGGGGLKSGAPLQTRVGIATGLVVVGDLIGSGEAQERGIVGETPNLAARLQSIAEPNTVVIAESTRKLLGNLFDLQDLGTQELKGVSGLVQSWAALRPSSVESRFEALRAATTPLIGRDEEVALLMNRWEQAKGGDGQVVLISGEPGIGKSRLAETIVERLAAEPHIRLRYFCSPHHQDSALHPVISQLERAAKFQREDTTQQKLEKLEALLSKGTDDPLREAAPLIADLLRVPTGDRYLGLELTPQKLKEKTLAALIAQVDGLSRREPLLMVYEDFHWSDPTTRELVEMLIDRVSTLRVLVVISFRPEFTPSWVGRPHVTQLILRRLAPLQRAEMIARVTGGKALPKEIADQIINRTDGVPLFIEELTKSVVESGLMIETGEGYAVTGPAVPLAIPTTLHASLLARLDRLAPTREVAQIAAALGRSFSHDLISAVAQMPRQKLDEALEQLVHAELIFRRGIPPDAEYTFKHALVQDAAYSTLLRSRRQQIHGRIVTTLEDQFPEVAAAEPALMAQHCKEAGLKEKTVQFWLKAGQQALARSATTEAVAQLRKGLEILSELPDGTATQLQELELLSALGSALTAAKGWSSADVSDTCSRARSLAEQLGRAEYLVPLIMAQYAFHLVRAEHKLALPLTDQLKKLGESRNDVSVQWLGCGLEGTTRFLLGELGPGRALLERFYRLSDPAHRTIEGLSFDAYAVLLTWFALALAYSGYVDQARSRMHEALSEARRLKHAHTLAHVLVFTDWLDWLVCSPIVHSTETIELSREHGFPHYLGWGLAYRGKALIELGHGQEAAELLTQGLKELRASEGVVSTPMLLTWLAEAHAMLGQPAKARSYLAEAAHVVEATEERVSEAELLHRVPGDLLNAIGDRDAAERRYRRSLEVAERQGARLFQLRASTSLARLWRDEGKPTEARDLLTPICGWFTEGFDSAVLQQAKSLLDELV